MKRGVATALPVVLIVSGCGDDNDTDDQSGLANPASVFCEEQGGTVETRTGGAGDQIGFCVFPDGTEVGEWAYFRGEAAPELPGE